MKKLAIFTFAVMAFPFISVQAQDVDEIINNTFEATGGIDAWANLKGIRMKAKVSQGGMEIPLEIVQMNDGRQYTIISLQGNTIKTGVFDGTTLWNTNFQTMKPEKADSESTENIKLEANDFPSPLFHYKDKGYQVELLGKETIDGTECYKIKLTKEPKTIDGQQVDDVSYYYLDTESNIILAKESEIKTGQAKGMISQVKFSDYDEVDGLYFPFSMSQGIKDGQSQPIIIESIELNPAIPDSAFVFPEN